MRKNKKANKRSKDNLNAEFSKKIIQGKDINTSKSLDELSVSHVERRASLDKIDDSGLPPTKKAWLFIKRGTALVWLIIGGVITVTGFTVWSILPAPEVVLKEYRNPGLLVFQIDNNSLFGMDSVISTLYVDKMLTFEGDTVSRLGISTVNVDMLKLSGRNSSSFFYDLNQEFFMYDGTPNIQKARVAIGLNYRFLTFKCEDLYFFECKPTYSSFSYWSKAPEQDYGVRFNLV